MEILGKENMRMTGWERGKEGRKERIDEKKWGGEMR
jgi:hypothetical protein